MLRGGRGLPCGKQQSAGPGPAEVLAQAVGQELPHDLGRVRHQAGQIYEEQRLRFDRQIVMLLSSLRAPRLIGIHGQIYGEQRLPSGSALGRTSQSPAPRPAGAAAPRAGFHLRPCGRLREVLCGERQHVERRDRLPTHPPPPARCGQTLEPSARPRFPPIRMICWAGALLFPGRLKMLRNARRCEGTIMKFWKSLPSTRT